MTLYRQYRPLHFRDVLGQPTVTATLQGALTKQRIGHAYLFTGPRGTGKTSTARIFGRAVCCLDLTSRGEPCDRCANCQALLGGQTDDFSEIDAASNRGIEDVRSLREQALYPPHLLPKRIFVIDEVHMLTNEAFNALLKLLEEPPVHCMFLLATTELQKVPLTIRSRCQTISFKAAGVEEIVKKLLTVSELENIRIDRQSLELIAAHAEGAFRDAETLLEQLAAGNDVVSEEVVLNELGIVLEVQIEQLLAAILAGKSGPIQRALLDIPQTRSGVIRQLLEQIRHLLYLPNPHPRLQLSFEKLLEAYILQRSAPDPRMPLEVACFSLCQLDEEEPTLRNPTPPPQNEVVLQTPEAPAPAATVPVITIIDKPELADNPKLQDVRRAWREMTDLVCRENTILGNTLKQAVLHTTEDNQILIHVRFKFHVDKFKEKKNQQRILSILHQLTDKHWQITYEVNADLPKRVSNRQIGAGLDDALAVFR